MIGEGALELCLELLPRWPVGDANVDGHRAIGPHGVRSSVGRTGRDQVAARRTRRIESFVRAEYAADVAVSTDQSGVRRAALCRRGLRRPPASAVTMTRLRNVRFHTN